MKIAIIGAGPAGCTLRRLLFLAQINFLILERDSSHCLREVKVERLTFVQIVDWRPLERQEWLRNSTKLRCMTENLSALVGFD
jgi:2-polyprenyl-6-methoxyphenol hydroxylase-like FAD-dependent oxidoreductase